MKINEVTTQRITEVPSTASLVRGPRIEKPKSAYITDPDKDSFFTYQTLGRPGGDNVPLMDPNENMATIIANMAAAGTLGATLMKLGNKVIAPKLALAIPGWGIGMGVYFAGKSVARGDYVGAALDLAMGISGGSFFGIKVFIALLAVTIWREIYKMQSDLKGEGRFPIEDLMHKGFTQEMLDNALNTVYFFPELMKFVGLWVAHSLQNDEMNDQVAELTALTNLKDTDLSEEQADMAKEIFELTYEKSTEEMEKINSAAIDASGKNPK